MRLLFDVVHPAHVHFFRHMRQQLIDDGHEALVVSRDKDVTLALLDHFAIPHVCAGRAATGGVTARAGELAARVSALVGHIRRFSPDVVATRNPAGVQAARLTRVPGVFDTDDGTAVGIHFRAARPFADVITTPACLSEDFGAKHRRYPGFKALAYLHPNRFRPDGGIRDELGLRPGEPLFAARFSAHSASHDAKVKGLPAAAQRAVVEHLAQRGRVVVSGEERLPAGVASLGLAVPPARFHDVLAAADLCVGDSQSVAAEAAVLGTPAYRLSSFSDRVDYLQVLEADYGLVRNFLPGDETAMLAAVARATDDLPGLARAAATRRRRLLSEGVDVTAWYCELLTELAASRGASRRRARKVPGRRHAR